MAKHERASEERKKRRKDMRELQPYRLLAEKAQQLREEYTFPRKDKDINNGQKE